MLAGYTAYGLMRCYPADMNLENDMSQADEYRSFTQPTDKLTKSVKLHTIYDAKYHAIQLLVEQIDRTIECLDKDYFATKPTEHQVVAHYAVKAQLWKFKGEIQQQQHAAYVELKMELGKLDEVK